MNISFHLESKTKTSDLRDEVKTNFQLPVLINFYFDMKLF